MGGIQSSWELQRWATYDLCTTSFSMRKESWSLEGQSLSSGQSTSSPNDDKLSQKQWTSGKVVLIYGIAIRLNPWPRETTGQYYRYVGLIASAIKLIDSTNLCFCSLHGGWQLHHLDARQVRKKGVVWKSGTTGERSETHFLGIHCSYCINILLSIEVHPAFLVSYSGQVKQQKWHKRKQQKWHKRQVNGRRRHSNHLC